MKGLLLAGGHGTRLRPLTFTGNKHMIPVANQPMLFYGLEHLARAGIREVAIILGPMHEGVQEAVGDGEKFGLSVTYIRQGDPKGLAHAVLCARDFLGDDPFVMYLGDNLLQEGVRNFVERFSKGDVDAVVGVIPVARPSSYGVVELGQDGRIVSIAEKPTEPRSNLALIGVYLFSPRIHPIIERLQPSPRNELEITEAIWKLHESGAAIAVRHVNGWWKDTGRPADLLEANALVLGGLPPTETVNGGFVSLKAKITGAVRIGAGSVISPETHLEGPVVIGGNVSIGPSVRLGPNASVGDHCRLGRGATVQDSILMEGVCIEGPVSVSNSIIGRGTKVTSGRADRDRVSISLVAGDATQLCF